ncbi:MAG: N-6 DNA methylase, partial [Bacteroidales bacterium]|nr:N-6 DNA methylase [Bacteroidales bacterium]
MCEDRGVEPYGNLKKAAEKGDIYENLFLLFHEADQKYNSGLFDFTEDRITRGLTIDNKVLKTIIGELYYPKCEFEFSVMPADILGSVYERFLGKVIRLTPAHHAKVEEKPEVRKAGGVYYTPKYIVDYIVEQTVGKLVEGKTPKQVSELKICDPACGSGSFLIGAYQYLLDWHLRYYTTSPPHLLSSSPLQVAGERGRGEKETRGRGEKETRGRGEEGKRGIGKFLTPDGNLTGAEKKRILLNNIYGVDIDPQAVEVTKLNLLLKALEGETQASINQQMHLFHERVLPNLGHNIQCGNSLIAPDFYDDQLDLFSDQVRKINAFDWQRAFPEVFKMGGFDCVIGNPPYLKLTLNNTDSSILSYYKKNFRSYSGGSSKNLFQLFLEKVVSLSKNYFSFIVPESLLTTESNGEIRAILLKNFNLNSIATFNHFVFQDATIGTTIVVGQKNENQLTDIIKIDYLFQQNFIQAIKLIPSYDPWDISVDDESKRLFSKMEKSSVLMGSLVEMSKGMVVKNRQKVLLDNPVTDSIPFLLGNCMSRYSYFYDKYAIYNELEIVGGTRDLAKHKSIPRLLIRRTGNTLCSAYSEKPELVESTIYMLRSENVNLKYLLGLVNSKLFSFYLSKRLITNTQGFPQVLMGQLEKLPIKITKENNQVEIIKLVDQIIALKSQITLTTLPSYRDQIQRAIDHAERRIDEMVYELYELTEEEIAIIKGNSSTHGRIDTLNIEASKH